MRVQFDINEDEMARLQVLFKKAGIETRKDLFNQALSFFEWAANERAAGRTIQSIDVESGKRKEIVVPVLEALAKMCKHERQTANSE